MVTIPPAGPAPNAQARATIVRFTAAAFCTRPRSAPAQNRNSVVCDGNACSPRSASVAPSNSERSDKNSPPAKSTSTRVR